MTRGRFFKSTSIESRFISEQIGASENDLKGEIVALLQSWNGPLRAYLARVKYGEEREFNVALCLAYEGGEKEDLAENCASIFRRMFGSHEHLDILFLTDAQEHELRNVCCPFFSSKRFNAPDFYLTSSGGHGLEEVRACYKERRLMNGHAEGYMLCEIDPPLVGQPYGLGGEDIRKVILASRHAGYSLFTVEDWPIYVHVARLLRHIPDNKFLINKPDIESIAWGEVYGSSEAAASCLG